MFGLEQAKLVSHSLTTSCGVKVSSVKSAQSSSGTSPPMTGEAREDGNASAMIVMDFDDDNEKNQQRIPTQRQQSQNPTTTEVDNSTTLSPSDANPSQSPLLPLDKRAFNQSTNQPTRI